MPKADKPTAATQKVGGKREGAGRKHTVFGGTEQPVTLVVRATQETISSIDAAAAALGRSRSDLVRDALAAYLKNHALPLDQQSE